MPDKSGTVAGPGTMMEWIIDAYQRIRLYIAAASLTLVLLFAILGYANWELFVMAGALLVMFTHAATSRVRRVRAPRLALMIDLTLINTALLFSVTPATSAVNLAVNCALITFLARGASRWALYSYAVAWFVIFVLLTQPTPADQIAIGGSVLFSAGVLVFVLSTFLTRSDDVEAQRAHMVSSVSHELRNQLTGVIGMTTLASEGSSDLSASELRELSAIALGQAHDAVEIIEDLLVSSRMESLAFEVEPEPVDVSRELATVVHRFGGDRAIELVPGLSSVSVLADPLRLRQVIRNLCSNAIRYGGDHIEMTLEERGPMVAIQVIDDGPGVPEGEADSIFLPYRRSASSRRAAGSVGLGLSVSRQLARAMGGDLQYRREAEMTIFEMVVPRFDPGVQLAGAPAVSDARRSADRAGGLAFSRLPMPAGAARFGVAPVSERA